MQVGSGSLLLAEERVVKKGREDDEGESRGLTVVVVVVVPDDDVNDTVDFPVVDETTYVHVDDFAIKCWGVFL